MRARDGALGEGGKKPFPFWFYVFSAQFVPLAPSMIHGGALTEHLAKNVDGRVDDPVVNLGRPG